MDSSYISVSNGSATQNGSIVAKSVSGGTRPEIHIGQRNGNTTEPRISINSSGNVGISDSGPTRALSVAGSMNLSSGSRIESYSSGGNLIIQGGSTYPGGHLKMYGGTASGGDKIEFCTSGQSASSTVRFRLESNGSLRLTPEGSTANPNARIDTSGDNIRINTMKDGSGGCGFIILTQHSGAVGERFRISTDGAVTKPSNVAWSYRRGGTIGSWGSAAGLTYGGLSYRTPLPLFGNTATSTDYDTHSSLSTFNTGGGTGMKFTAPVTGKYMVVLNMISVRCHVQSDWGSIGLMVNTTATASTGSLDYMLDTKYTPDQNGSGTDQFGWGGSVIISLTQNDYIVPYGMSCEHWSADNMLSFMGYLLG